MSPALTSKRSDDGEMKVIGMSAYRVADPARLGNNYTTKGRQSKRGGEAVDELVAWTACY